MEVEVREIKFNDLDEIAEIEKICFSLPWSKELLSKELLNKMAYYQCATVNGTVVGYMGMWKICDEGHITNIAVLPEYRKKGIASKLISKMFDVCRCSEIKNITLEARESNLEAIRLYEKFGFESSGKRPNYYQRPNESAVIMWKKISI
nr:ribosomal protein S18-alanine N-acetyltransferase [Sedimentibacter sp.]